MPRKGTGESPMFTGKDVARRKRRFDRLDKRGFHEGEGYRTEAEFEQLRRQINAEGGSVAAGKARKAYREYDAGQKKKKAIEKIKKKVKRQEKAAQPAKKGSVLDYLNKTAPKLTPTGAIKRKEFKDLK